MDLRLVYITKNKEKLNKKVDPSLLEKAKDLIALDDNLKGSYVVSSTKVNILPMIKDYMTILEKNDSSLKIAISEANFKKYIELTLERENLQRKFTIKFKASKIKLNTDLSQYLNREDNLTDEEKEEFERYLTLRAIPAYDMVVYDLDTNTLKKIEYYLNAGEVFYICF